MLKLSRQIPEIANKFVLLTVSDCKFAAAAVAAASRWKTTPNRTRLEKWKSAVDSRFAFPIFLRPFSLISKASAPITQLLLPLNTGGIFD